MEFKRIDFTVLDWSMTATTEAMPTHTELFNFNQTSQNGKVEITYVLTLNEGYKEIGRIKTVSNYEFSEDALTVRIAATIGVDAVNKTRQIYCDLIHEQGIIDIPFIPVTLDYMIAAVYKSMDQAS